MATAGFGFAVLHPTVYVGAIDPATGFGPTWPNRLASKNQVWPSAHPTMGGAGNTNGWTRFWGHNNGMQVTLQDPQANIQTSDRGILGQVSTGAHGIQLASQTKTPVKQFVDWFNKLAKNTLTAVGGTAEVRTLTITGTASSAGTAVIVIDNVVYTVPISNGATNTAIVTTLGTTTNYTPTLTGWTVGTATNVATYTATSPGAHTGLFQFSTNATGITGAWATTTPGVAPTSAPGVTQWFDPNGAYGSVQQFAVGIEAQTQPGTWSDVPLLVRFIAHAVNQGGNNALRFDDSGNDAPFVINLAGQCMPRQVTALELLNTGFSVADQDPYGKATWWIANLT